LLLTCCLAVIAAVLAVQAFAMGTDQYCWSCTLSSSGVPAVSTDHHTFNYNNINTTDGRYDEHIYFYSVSGGNFYCQNYGYSTYGISKSGCNTGGVDSTARCQLIDGTGPASVTFCYSEFYNN
jgi:hypothetical protein